MGFVEEKAKLINDWPEDRAERKRRIRELYELMCNEADAELAQLKALGYSDDRIYRLMDKAINRQLKGLL